MPIEQLTVTRRQRGKGWNPKSDGFQIAACSAHVDEDSRTFLYERYMQLGSALHPASGVKALSATHRQLDAWYSSADKSSPAEAHRAQEDILGEFPVFYDYVALPGTDRFALAEIRYKGYRHQGGQWRPGIFLAHAFIFCPAELEPFDDNPLTAARLLPFQGEDDGSTQLPSLETFDGPSGAKPDFRMLTEKPWRGHVGALVEALIGGVHHRKPVRVYVPTFDTTLALGEAALALLPPTVRSRCSLCTFVDDRKRAVARPAPNGEQETASEPPATLLSFIYKPSGDTSVTVRDADYREDAGATILNVADERFSEALDPRPYARFAADCVDGRTDQLEYCQAVIEALGKGAAVEAWDSLLPAVALPDSSAGFEAVAAGIKATSPFAVEPERADRLLGWVLSHVRALAQARDAAALEQLHPEASDLADKAGKASQNNHYTAYLETLTTFSGEAMADGEGSFPTALLALSGTSRERLLLDLLNDLVPDANGSLSVSSRKKEATAFLNLLVDGVKAAWGRPDQRDLFARLTIVTFRTAAAATLADHVWEQTGSQVLTPFFRADWQQNDAALADTLVTLDARIERLNRQRMAVDQLGVDRKSAAWDALESAAELLAVTPDPQAIRTGMEAVLEQPVSADRTAVLAEWVRPHIRRLAEDDDAQGLAALAPTVARVADTRPPPGAAKADVDVADDVRQLAGEALAQTHYRTVIALLAMCGASEPARLTDLLQAALTGDDSILELPSQQEERQAAVDLLLKGVKAAAETGSPAEWLDRVTIAAFHTAADAALVACAWGQVGDRVIVPAVTQNPTPARIEMVRTVLEWVTPETCLDGHIRCQFLLVKYSDQSSGRLMSSLEYLAGLAPKSSQPLKTVEELVRVTREKLTDVDRRAEVLGHMTEAVDDRTAAEPLVAAYLETIEGVPSDERRNAIRIKLAGDGAATVLCRELLEYVIPWQGAESAKMIQKWQSGPLAHAKIADSLRSEVAGLLRATQTPDDVLPLAEQVISPGPREESNTVGITKLSNALVESLPLAPLAERWQKKLDAVRSCLEADNTRRLGLLEYMAAIQKKSRQPDWALASFRSQDDPWRNAVKRLEPEEKKAVLTWWIDTFKGSGITTPKDAEALVKAIHAVDTESPQAPADVATRFLGGRDDLTWANAVMAFVRRAMQPGVDTQHYATIAGRIADSGNRKLAGLLKEHLAKGCFPADTDSQRRLREVCGGAGLTVPPVRPPESESGKDDHSRVASGDRHGTIGKRFGGFVKSLFGGKS